MIQRYDISLERAANRLSIKEFAAIGRKLGKNGYSDSAQERFSFIHEVSYDGDRIRAAINKGQEALISELRSDNFFPIYSWAKIMAEEVTNLFNGSLDHFSELFFDDQNLFSEDDEAY